MKDSSWQSDTDEADFLCEEEVSYTDEELAALKAASEIVRSFVAASPEHTAEDLKGGNSTFFCLRVEDAMKKRFILNSSRRRELRKLLPSEAVLEELCDKALSVLLTITALIKGQAGDEKLELIESERNLRTVIAACFAVKTA